MSAGNGGGGLALVPGVEPGSDRADEFNVVFPAELLDALADRLAPRVAVLLRGEVGTDQWLDSSQAADYLGMTRDALHKHTSARTIPFEQEGPGCKLYFRRSALDRWRSGGRLPN